MSYAISGEKCNESSYMILVEEKFILKNLKIIMVRELIKEGDYLC